MSRCFSVACICGLLLVQSSVSQLAFAQIGPSLPPSVDASVAPAAEIPSIMSPEQVEDLRANQEINRANKVITIGGTFGLYSILVPWKKGGYLTYLHNEEWTFELDYFSGDFGLKKFGIDLASVEERLVTLKVRKYWNSSFNLTYGIGERRSAFELGRSVTERFPNVFRYDSTLLEIKRTFVTLGIGNRWHFANGITVGADWLEAVAPVGGARARASLIDKIPEETIRHSAWRVVRFLQNSPTINFVKASIGYSF